MTLHQRGQLTQGTWVALIAILISLLTTFAVEALHSDQTTLARVSALEARQSGLEAHQGDQTQRLDRIETKVDNFMRFMGVPLPSQQTAPLDTRPGVTQPRFDQPKR